MKRNILFRKIIYCCTIILLVIGTTSINRLCAQTFNQTEAMFSTITGGVETRTFNTSSIPSGSTITSANITVDASNGDLESTGSFSVFGSSPDEEIDVIVNNVNVGDYGPFVGSPSCTNYPPQNFIVPSTLISPGSNTIVFLNATTSVNAQCAAGVSWAASARLTVNYTLAGCPAAVANCPGNETLDTDAGVCTHDYVVQNITVADPCLVATVTVNSNPSTIGATVSLTEGDNFIEYTVTESGNAANSASCIQTVTIEDNEIPDITVLGADPQTIECSTAYTELGATADDNCDGNGLTVTNIDASAVITGTPGSYIVTYDFADAAGNNAAQVTRVVNVTAAPATINGVCYLKVADAILMANPGEIIEVIADLSEAGPLTIPTGVTLDIGAGLSWTVTSGDFINNGTLTGDGDITVSNGNIINNGSCESTGTMTCITFDNDGTMDYD